MKTCYRIMSVMLAFVLLAACLTGCGEKSGVKKVIRDFETACQEADVDGMLDCFNPDIINPLRTTLDLFGMGDLSGAMDTVAGLLPPLDFTGADISEVLESIRFEPKDFDFNRSKDNCDVSTEIRYTVNGNEYRNVYIVSCRQVGDDWYITGIK